MYDKFNNDNVGITFDKNCKYLKHSGHCKKILQSIVSQLIDSSYFLSKTGELQTIIFFALTKVIPRSFLQS
ncbi:Protein of unknown function [Cotesia congregata]|uniref:Uncharacterized protein n=1 Tax=Cotesia congregata TaxID=51543 RepID=A0A8J2HM95_COTCN|nr:Protein of unknown function [Cotesia congregata]